MASPTTYQWQPLTTPTSFRLMRLLPGRSTDDLACEIMVADLWKRPVYSAVSYVCGSEENKADIRCGNHILKITRNLEAALRQFRYPIKTRIFWVDSICIDQSSNHEKKHQVHLMGKIYENATKVLAWVCDEEVPFNMQALANSLPPFRRAGMKLIDFNVSGDLRGLRQTRRRTYEDLQSEFGLPAPDSEEIVALSNFWSHQYFRRAWTFQECFLAKTSIFHFGPFKYSSSFLRLALLGYMAVRSPILETVVLNLDIDAHVYLIDTKEELRLLGSNGSARALSNLLTLRRGARCKNPRDLVYSLLGSTSDDVRIESDYDKPVHLVFVETFIHIVQTSGNLEVLRQVYPVTGPSELPSWLPDWGWHPHKSGPTTAATPRIIYESGGIPYKCMCWKKPVFEVSADGRKLIIQGHAYDIVETKPQLTEDQLVDHYKKSLRFATSDENITIDGWSKEQMIAIWRTFAAGLDIPHENYNKPWGDSSTNTLFRALREVTKGEIELNRLLHICENIIERARGRQFIVTKADGKPGLGPEHALSGDIVVLAYGGEAPLLLRRTANQPEEQFYFVGECYIDGIMNGEAFDLEKLPPARDFVLI